MAESIVRLRVETRNAVSSLNNASVATSKLSLAAKGATGSLTAASGAATGLGATLKATLGPLIAVGSAVTLLGRSLSVFSDRERDAAILLQGLQNLGQGTHTLNELIESADRLGNATLFSQDEFTRGFALLTSFRKIGVDAYERVAEEAANIAQINQVDVNTSFMQLAKALQDPERNLSNLNRSGIAFSKQQTEVIKNLMKTNKVAEAHAMILDIVKESYEETALAASEGFAGNVDLLKEEFADFAETLGSALIPVLDPTVKLLTKLLTFLSSEGGQATAIIAGIILAAKGLTVVLPLLSTQFIQIKTAALIATGQLVNTNATLQATSVGFANATAAATAFKGALAKTGIGLVVIALGTFITRLLQANSAQKEFNDLLEQGTAAQFNEEIEERRRKIEKLEEKIASANKVLDFFSGLVGLHSFGITKGITDFRLEVAELKNEIKGLQEGMPEAEARDLARAFKNQRQNLIASNTELEKQLIIEAEATDLAQIRKESELNIQKIIEEHGVVRGQELILLEHQNLELKEQKLEQDKITAAAEQTKRVMEELGKSIATGISDALVDVLMQAKSISDVVNALLNDMARQFLRLGINTALKASFGGIFDALPSFAEGGRPPIGKMSLVGEKGPELFIPDTAGTIIPNNQLGSGGGGNVVVNVAVDATGSSVEGEEEEGRQLGRLIAAAVQSEIVQQKRPGGLLA